MSVMDSLVQNEELLTVKDLVARLRISKTKIYEMVQSGDLPHVKFGSAIRFDPKAIAEWVKRKSTT